jgi:hypothetical protein
LLKGRLSGSEQTLRVSAWAVADKKDRLAKAEAVSANLNLCLRVKDISTTPE